MKIVITGGAGYIASALQREISKKLPEARIILLDNLSLGKPAFLKQLSRNVRFIKGDIRTFDYRRLALKPGDWLIHLAALSTPAQSFGRAQEFKAVNYTAALRAARHCAAHGIYFFFPSSTSVYSGRNGKRLRGRRTEIRPQTPYARLKFQAEEGIRNQKQLKFVIARFGTIFGLAPRINAQTAVNRFCSQAQTGRPLSVWKTASKQFRPYLAIGDAVRFLTHCIRFPDRLSCKTVNVVSVNSRLEEAIGLILKLRPGTPVQLENSPAMNDLSYKVTSYRDKQFRPEGNLKTGIRELLRGLKKPLL